MVKDAPQKAEEKTTSKRAPKKIAKKQRPTLIEVERLEDLPVDNSLAHTLPMPKIESRHATAIISSFHGIRKDVIKLFLTFNKAARVFIINSNG